MNVERLQYLLDLAIKRGDHAAEVMLRARIAAARGATRTPGGLVW